MLLAFLLPLLVVCMLGLHVLAVTAPVRARQGAIFAFAAPSLRSPKWIFQVLLLTIGLVFFEPKWVATIVSVQLARSVRAHTAAKVRG